MPPTKLLYLENFSLLECAAEVLGTFQENERGVLVLDQTVFYPQGGGQPYDTGIIESVNGKFIVEEVRFAESIVKHIGKIVSGSFIKGEAVKCVVDRDRRLLHSKIHSAGHLVDWAIQKLGIPWTPDPRGYHYPNGPYVSYAGKLEEIDKEKLKKDLESAANDAIKEGREVTIRFMSASEIREISRSAPQDIPAGQLARVIFFGDFGVPCGGTHVANISKIGHLTIRKIKQEGEVIRIGYDVPPRLL